MVRYYFPVMEYGSDCGFESRLDLMFFFHIWLTKLLYSIF